MKALDKRKDAMTIQLLGIVTTGAPVIILTAMSNFKELSVYAVYGMIAGSLTTCLTVFTSGLSASFGNIYASETEEKLQKIVSEFITGFYFVLTIIYTIAVITIVPFVDVYTKGINDVNYHVPVFGFLIVAKGVIEHLYSPHGMFVQSFGKFKELRLCFLFQAIIAVIATAVLTKRWGIDGAMGAMIVTHIYTVVYYLVITRKKIVRISIRHNLKLMISVLSIFCGCYLVSRLHSFMVDTYPQWILYALSVGTLVIIVTTVSFLMVDRQNMILLSKRVFKKKSGSIPLSAVKNKIDDV
ncbi:MAG: polysaccharide biosynthesis C-terminal domain-containing protein [Muribaculum sp.]|nr:polysaccharide biosynthesis C-terminal domain-containing protein [Muribaculum sp.]